MSSYSLTVWYPLEGVLLEAHNATLFQLRMQHGLLGLHIGMATKDAVKFMAQKGCHRVLLNSEPVWEAPEETIVSLHANFDNLKITRFND